jgi:hypothetical protein
MTRTDMEINATTPLTRAAAPKLTLEDAKARLNKLFTPKAQTGFTAGKQFRVIEALEYDFRGHGRLVPSVRFQRVDAPESVTLLSLRKFLERFEEAKPTN